MEAKNGSIFPRMNGGESQLPPGKLYVGKRRLKQIRRLLSPFIVVVVGGIRMAAYVYCAKCGSRFVDEEVRLIKITSSKDMIRRFYCGPCYRLVMGRALVDKYQARMAASSKAIRDAAEEEERAPGEGPTTGSVA